MRLLWHSLTNYCKYCTYNFADTSTVLYIAYDSTETDGEGISDSNLCLEEDEEDEIPSEDLPTENSRQDIVETMRMFDMCALDDDDDDDLKQNTLYRSRRLMPVENILY